MYHHHSLTFAARIVEDTPFESEPIQLELARAHLNLLTYGEPPVHQDDVWLMTAGIPGARDWAERFTGRAIGQKRIQIASSGFPQQGCHMRYWLRDFDRYYEDGLSAHALLLPFSPVRAVTAVSYTDSTGAAAVVSDATLDQFSEPNRLWPVYGTPWPQAQPSANSVVVDYLVGYTLPTDAVNDTPLPPSIMSAMLLLLGHLYENRENTTIGRAANIQEIPLGAEAFLVPYSLRNGFA